MAKKDYDPEKYSERKHETGSVKEVMFNYKKAFDSWLVFRAGDNRFVFSSYICKQIVAWFSIFICLPFLMILDCGVTTYGIEWRNIITHPVLTQMLNTILNSKILSAEVSILLMVSSFQIWNNSFVVDRTEGYTILSYKYLRSLSSKRPNFILEDNIVNDISEDAIDCYISAFSFQRDCAKDGMDKPRTFETAAVLTLLISVITGFFSIYNSLEIILSICLAALILYLAKDVISAERYSKMRDCVMLEMILQDLHDVKLKGHVRIE